VAGMLVVWVTVCVAVAASSARPVAEGPFCGRVGAHPFHRQVLSSVLCVLYRFKLSDVARIGEVLEVTAACVDASDDTFVEVLVGIIRLCAKVCVALGPRTVPCVP
jgi:hypothetical protein